MMFVEGSFDSKIFKKNYLRSILYLNTLPQAKPQAVVFQYSYLNTFWAMYFVIEIKYILNVFDPTLLFAWLCISFYVDL